MHLESSHKLIDAVHVWSLVEPATRARVGQVVSNASNNVKGPRKLSIDQADSVARIDLRAQRG